MNTEFTLEELAREVGSWCEEHRVSPANGQASDAISERTIRYYRTIGLLDAPIGNYVKTFTEKHRLQLIAIRVYQAQGIPLRKIREELYGKSLADLQSFVERIEEEGEASAPLSVAFVPPSLIEKWSMAPLSHDFMLISRDGKALPEAVIEKINRLIKSVYETKNSKKAARNN